MTVRKRGRKHQVVSSTKGVIGTHPTRKKALAQHGAVMANKKKKSKRGKKGCK